MSISKWDLEQKKTIFLSASLSDLKKGTLNNLNTNMWICCCHFAEECPVSRESQECVAKRALRSRHPYISWLALDEWLASHAAWRRANVCILMAEGEGP